MRYEKNPLLTPGVAGQYKVVGKTSFGCADSAFVNVTVVPAPMIDTITNTAPVCASCNSNAILQAVIQPIYGPLTYTWTGPGGFMSTQPSPVIPGVCTDDNGTYMLVVRDSLGCPSLSKSTVVMVQKLPNTPIISPATISVCQGATVIVQVANANDYVGNFVRYIWKHVPGGLETTTLQPSLTVGPVSGQDAGNYSVKVIVDSCMSPMSANAVLEVKPTPSAPNATSPDPNLCEGETLQLFANPSSGEAYNWISIPPGISSTIPNPSYPNVDTTYTRKYLVRITVSGCVSGYSEPLQITVNRKPARPFLLPVQPICLDDPSAQLKLCVLPGTPGAKYQFFNVDKPGIPLGPPTTSTCFQTADLSGLQPGLNSFYAIALLDSCSSLPSELRTVQMDTVPNITAYAGPDSTACTSQPLLLHADDPGEGTWIQVSGPPTTILDPNNDFTLVTGLVPDTTYRYKWTLSNGACKNYSRDTVQITSVSFEVAEAKDFERVCTTQAQLMATPAVTTTGVWTQSPIQAQLGIVIEDPSNPLTLVSNLNRSQTYYFYWVLDDTGCGPTSDTTTIQVLSEKPLIGADFSVCDAGDCAGLDVLSTLPASESGEWSSQNLALDFGNSSNENTTVCNLQTGANIIYWITNDTFCGSESIDTVIINFGRFPTAVADTMVVPFGQQVLIDVLQNDILPADIRVEIVEGGEPEHGNLDTLGNGQYYYQPFAGYVGPDQLIYRVCNIACPNMDEACSVATVKFTVQDITGCPLPTLITPNGDDVNDELVFPCLVRGDGTIESELTVFNQWGNEVFHQQPYDNKWQGDYNGEPLPAGTYFYILTAGYLDKPVSRFLIIQR